jgi:hypothetical protein
VNNHVILLQESEILDRKHVDYNTKSRKMICLEDFPLDLMNEKLILWQQTIPGGENACHEE